MNRDRNQAKVIRKINVLVFVDNL